VRGDNKISWGLIIVCLPIAGALLYGYMGAASFLPRSTGEPVSLWQRTIRQTRWGRSATDEAQQPPAPTWPAD
jgi:Phospholipase_D-nuclease N-terminal